MPKNARGCGAFSAWAERAVGYVLRLQRGSVTIAFGKAALWMLRGKHLVLIPGDSPIGFRLPVASLPWVPTAEYPLPSSARPHGPGGAAGPEPISAAWPASRQPGKKQGSKAGFRSAIACPNRRIGAVGRANRFVRRAARRTTACVSSAGAAIEDYLELVAAIEDTAAALDMSMVIEGNCRPTMRMTYAKSLRIRASSRST